MIHLTSLGNDPRPQATIYKSAAGSWFWLVLLSIGFIAFFLSLTVEFLRKHYNRVGFGVDTQRFRVRLDLYSQCYLFSFHGPGTVVRWRRTRFMPQTSYGICPKKRRLL